MSVVHKTIFGSKHPRFRHKCTIQERKNISIGTKTAMHKPEVFAKIQANNKFRRDSGMYKDKNNHMYGKSPHHGKWFDFYNPDQGWLRLRSSWELIVATYLVKKQVKFLYESKRFTLDNKTFLPDFYLIDKDKFIEVKGRKSDGFMKKWSEMRQMHPNVKIELWEGNRIEAIKEEVTI